MSRKFALPIIFVILVSLLLAACGPTATPTPVTIIETVEVEVSVVETVEVIKEVEGETVVEYVEVTPTPEPEAPPPEKPTGAITLWGWTAAIRDTIEAAGVVMMFTPTCRWR